MANYKKIKIEFKPRLKDAALGLAYKDERRIEIKKGLDEFETLDTIIHELQHIIHPFLDELAIECSSTMLAEHLWNLGYRKLNTNGKNNIKNKKR